MQNGLRVPTIVVSPKNLLKGTKESKQQVLRFNTNQQICPVTSLSWKGIIQNFCQIMIQNMGDILIIISMVCGHFEHYFQINRVFKSNWLIKVIIITLKIIFTPYQILYHVYNTIANHFQIKI